MTKIKIQLEDGKIIERKPMFDQVGNFVQCLVRYDNGLYMLNEWEGDEYLRGDIKDYYTLGKVVRRLKR